MASVLFTAFALIAAGQAQIPAAPAETGRAQTERADASVVGADAAPRVKSRDRR